MRSNCSDYEPEDIATPIGIDGAEPLPGVFDGSEILLEAHNLVNCDRGQSYGHPSDDYRKVRDIFESLTGISLSVEQAVLFPLAMKLARIRTHMETNSFHRDSVVDAAGYLACLSMVVERSRQ